MKRERIYANTVLTAVFVLALLAGCKTLFTPAPKLTPQEQECVDRVNSARDLIKAKGLEAAMKEINADKSPFMEEPYVFGIDGEAKILAHPAKRILGWKMMKYQSADGKTVFKDMIELAKKEKCGWYSYMYRGRDTPEAKLKKTYWLKVPGEEVILGAGFYVE